MKSVINKRYLLTGFLIINILTGVCSGIISMVLPLFAVSIKANTAQIGLIKGISGIGALIMVLPSGFFVDYFGSKRLYVFGSVVSALTVFLLAVARTPELVIAAMALQGFSNSLRFTSLNAAFFKYLKQLGLEKAGWYRGAMSIGLTFAGPLIGGYFLKYLNYKTIFIIVAFITLLPTVALIPMIRKGGALNSHGGYFNYRQQLKEFIDILQDRILRETVLAEGLSTACFCSFATFIIVYVVKNLSVKSYYASWFLILEGSAYILMVFFGGKLLYLFSRRKLYFVSFMIMVAGLFFIAVSQNIGIILPGIILLGLGTGVLNLVTYSNLSNVNAQKGKVSSLLSACTSTGATFGPMFGGFIGEVLGFRAIFLAYIPLFILLLAYIYTNKIIPVEKYSINNVNMEYTNVLEE